MKPRTGLLILALAAPVMLLSGCVVGPSYRYEGLPPYHELAR